MNSISGIVALSGMMLCLKMWHDVVEVWRYNMRAKTCFKLIQEIVTLIKLIDN